MGHYESIPIKLIVRLQYYYFQEAHDVAKQKKRLDCYTTSCRQLAYDNSLFDVVELIDTKNNQLFRGMLPRVRVPRMRRPPPITPDPLECVEEVTHDSIEDQQEEVDDTVDSSNVDNLTVSNFEDICDSDISSVYSDNHNESREDIIDCDNDGDSMVEEIVPTESEIAAKEYLAIMESLKCARYLQRIHFQRSRTVIDKASNLAGNADDGYGTSSTSSCQTSPTSKYSRTGRHELPRHATKASIMLKRQTDLLTHRYDANFKMLTSELTKSCLFNEGDTRWRRSKKRHENTNDEIAVNEKVIELKLDPVRTQSPWHEDKPLHPARSKPRYSRSKSAEIRPHTTDRVRTISNVIFNLNMYQNSPSFGTRFPLLSRQTLSRACSLPSRKSCAR